LISAVFNYPAWARGASVPLWKLTSPVCGKRWKAIRIARESSYNDDILNVENLFDLNNYFQKIWP
jgi:hypothetical protein